MEAIKQPLNHGLKLRKCIESNRVQSGSVIVTIN